MRNTSKVGEISMAQVIAALTKRGESVLIPFGDHRRYDFAIEKDRSQIIRVQCKTAYVNRGSVRFATCSVDSRSAKGHTIRKGYKDEIDLFGVYCPATEKVYLVPVDEVPCGEACLRLVATRNNQKSKVRWAKDFEIGAVAQLGAR